SCGCRVLRPGRFPKSSRCLLAWSKNISAWGWLVAERGTITGADWARALPAARARREGAAARMFSGPACPSCGEPGLHQQLGEGMVRVVHARGVACLTLINQ